MGTNRLFCLLLMQLSLSPCYGAELPTLSTVGVGAPIHEPRTRTATPSPLQDLRFSVSLPTILDQSTVSAAHTEHTTLTTHLKRCRTQDEGIRHLRVALARYEREGGGGTHPLDAIDEAGNTALMILINRGFITAVQALLRENFAKVLVKNRRGLTSLLYALEKRQYDIFCYLLNFMLKHIQSPTTTSAPTIIVHFILAIRPDEGTDALGFAAQSEVMEIRGQCTEALCRFYHLIPPAIQQSLVIVSGREVSIRALLEQSRRAALAQTIIYGNQPAFMILSQQSWAEPFNVIVRNICIDLAALGTTPDPHVPAWLTALEEGS